MTMKRPQGEDKKRGLEGGGIPLLFNTLQQDEQKEMNIKKGDLLRHPLSIFLLSDHGHVIFR